MTSATAATDAEPPRPRAARRAGAARARSRSTWRRRSPPRASGRPRTLRCRRPSWPGSTPIGAILTGATSPEPPTLWSAGATRLLDYGPARRPPLLVVPSLINRAYILDLAPGAACCAIWRRRACGRCWSTGASPGRSSAA